MNNYLPSTMDVAVEQARNMKLNYNRFFEDELLAQIANFLKKCDYHVLTAVDGKIIRLTKSQLSDDKTGSKYGAKIYIDVYAICIKSNADLVTEVPGDLSSMDIYAGLNHAYNSIINKIESGEKIAGLSVIHHFFRCNELKLNIK